MPLNKGRRSKKGRECPAGIVLNETTQTGTVWQRTACAKGLFLY